MAMAISGILYTKIVDNEDKEDGAPFVAPKARGGGGMLAPRCIDACFDELVGKHASLG